ncbi:MAG: DUF2232 domain-containing protein [Methylococcaceae bacterium]|nr:DUF2232 domain-containing protein [Methylococcaceae bacterium]
MNALARFIMKGRSEAILVIAALTILSWGLSPASLLAAAAIALPTLRRGGKEGARLILGALPIVALAGYILLSDAVQAGGYSLVMWIPILLVAIILRETASLSIAVLSALALGWLVVAGMYAMLSDPAAFWLDTLQQVLKPMLEQRGTGVDEGLINQTIQLFSRYATGAIAAGSIMTVLISLLLARWWQANLYNPGGFRDEFQQFRLPAPAGYVFLVLLIAGMASSGGVQEFSVNLLMPALMVYMLAGFSVIHALCSSTRAGRFWLAGIYVGLMFIAPLILVITLVGLSDSWFNWRQRFASAGG